MALHAIDPQQSLLENWLVHEATEVYTYYSCLQQAQLFKKHERRDPEDVVGNKLPEPIPFESQREFVRATLAREVDLRASGPDFVDREQEPQSSLDYRNHMNSEGSPSETVAAGYVWQPGTELTRKVANL